MSGVLMDFRENTWVPKHTHVKMSWLKYEIYKKHGHESISSSFTPPFSVVIHETSSPSSSPGAKISPVILFIIIILAVLFFLSGLLHLLVRFLNKYHSSTTSYRSNRYPDHSTPDTLQRQLQQLFHLNDSGLDQSFIDTLPVFMYKEIVAVTAKESSSSFDCAVCLCEFCEMDKLRLLPTCSHAFHINCIDTWLLSNSTCPLCRNTLFNPGFSIDNPIFEFDEMREVDDGRLAGGTKRIEERIVAEKGVFLVRLGKFRKLIDGGEVAGGESSSSNLDARRCYSMGSYEYVVGDTSLRLALNQQKDRQDAKLVKAVEGDEKLTIIDETEGKKINIGAKTDSYSNSSGIYGSMKNLSECEGVCYAFYIRSKIGCGGFGAGHVDCSFI
ncbi:hypothetical protein LXL04_013303 [Taraxacum kok-saghyz]